ncbi:MAG TPA: four helix bundle protein [Candidatus Acidoferrales bacterium]|nr:four helix bundle protein [Candidatus Acidoferrales bacterium]
MGEIQMKLQAPTSKLQRNSKLQASNLASITKYPDFDSGAWVLNETPNGDGSQKHAFDLEERTARFGEEIIRFVKKIPRNAENNRLIGQIVGCGTSVGANYCEANEGVSKKDFKNTIGRCVKEAKETKFFLRMIAASEPKLADEARTLYREAKELHLIFASIFRK